MPDDPESFRQALREKTRVHGEINELNRQIEEAEREDDDDDSGGRSGGAGNGVAALFVAVVVIIIIGIILWSMGEPV